MSRHVPQHLDEAERREAARVLEKLHARRSHRIPADAHKVERRA
jgi:hypothetical protein